MTDELVGYRVGARSPEGDATAEDDEGRRVRLVRIRDGDAGGEAALSAWLGVGGEHVQRVLDLGRAPNGDLVVVIEEQPHALAGLIDVRPLEAGEAVTVLVPVAEAVAALHTAGIVHGALGVPAISMTDAGAPVLLLPRTARRSTPDGAGFGADRRALVALARVLLPPPLPDALLQALEQDPGEAGADALFRLAEPTPVLLDRRPDVQERTRTPGRLLAPVPPMTPVAPVPPAAPVSPVPPTWVVAPEPADGPHGKHDEPGERGHPALLRSAVAAVRGLRSGAARVRPRVWLTAGVSLAALAGALVLLPGHGAAARGPAEPAVVVGRPTAIPSPAAPVRTGTPPASPAPTGSPSAVSGSVEPASAAAALLDARARCLAAGTADCLSDVDAAGSPVDGLDRAALAAGVDPVLPPPVHPVLLRDAGATAVLAVGPCTVLEIRGPGGWRLRDVLAPAADQMPSASVKSPSSSRARTAARNLAASAPSTMRWS